MGMGSARNFVPQARLWLNSVTGKIRGLGLSSETQKVGLFMNPFHVMKSYSGSIRTNIRGSMVECGPMLTDRGYSGTEAAAKHSLLQINT
jgi:hypothetical protein